MPRVARQMSNSGVYHVMVRGINRQNIFLEHEDYQRFLSTLAKVKGRSGCLVLAYCLMSNHAHLLLQETQESVGQVMKRMGSSYVRWFNGKYERAGHLFQDRFLSEAVEDDRYLLAVLRYIHLNPVKAGLADNCASYPWSSYMAYLTPQSHKHGLADTDFIMGILGGVSEFIRVSALVDTDEVRLKDVKPVTDDILAEVLNELLEGRPLETLSSMKRLQRDRIVSRLKDLPGVTYTQIAKVTGLSPSIVQRAAKKVQN